MKPVAIQNGESVHFAKSTTIHKQCDGRTIAMFILNVIVLMVGHGRQRECWKGSNFNGKTRPNRFQSVRNLAQLLS